MKKPLSSNSTSPVMSSQAKRTDCKHFAGCAHEYMFISGFTRSTVSKPKHEVLIIKVAHEAAHHD
ncbi:uncharacterized protein METZ01_LOCUS182896 [marine metagenome]|uniref:Uncharacterized protein n=1 Tax=marine metagenome TaxID=408172 RepID=A0A382CW13_9ZZZZ